MSFVDHAFKVLNQHRKFNWSSVGRSPRLRLPTPRSGFDGLRHKAATAGVGALRATLALRCRCK